MQHLQELLQDVFIPDSIYESPPMQRLLDAAIDAICWNNDIWSFKKVIILLTFKTFEICSSKFGGMLTKCTNQWGILKILKYCILGKQNTQVCGLTSFFFMINVMQSLGIMRNNERNLLIFMQSSDLGSCSTPPHKAFGLSSSKACLEGSTRLHNLFNYTLY